MSKRAEEQAVKWHDSVKYKSDLSGTPISGYIAGYEQAEKDTIERAARWIMKSENQAEAMFRITDDEFIEFFRKEMEEE